MVFGPSKTRGESSPSFKDLFGQELTGSCPLALRSSVILANVNEQAVLQPAAALWKTGEQSNVRFLDLANKDLFQSHPLLNVQFKLDPTPPSAGSIPLVLFVFFSGSFSRFHPFITENWFEVTRKVIGATDESGKFVTTLRNAHASHSFQVSYFDWIPWFLRVYLHTATVTINGEEGQLPPPSISLNPHSLLFFFTFVSSCPDRKAPPAVQSQGTAHCVGILLCAPPVVHCHNIL